MTGQEMDRETLNALLRRGRRAAYRLVDPFDRLFLRINKLSAYPPLSLRRHVSSLGCIDGGGQEYHSYLRLLTGLKSNHRLMDLGCGCGLLELALERMNWDGDLVAIDIHKPSIDWCAATIGRRQPRYRFVHANIYNSAYWRRGAMNAETWLRTFDETNFDCVIVKSVFTHMLPEELQMYLSDLPRRLKPRSRALLTFFLLKSSGDHQITRKAEISFGRPSPDAPYAVRRLTAPTAAVAYDLTYVLSSLARVGLELVPPIFFGSWSGEVDALSYQDIMIVRRA